MAEVNIKNCRCKSFSK